MDTATKVHVIRARDAATERLIWLVQDSSDAVKHRLMRALVADSVEVVTKTMLTDQSLYRVVLDVALDTGWAMFECHALVTTILSGE